MRNNNLEEIEQIAVMDWCRWQEKKHPELGLIFHIVNEGKRNKMVGLQLQKMGMKKGIPDICLPVSNGKYNSLWIELKADKTKRLTKEQKDWIKKLNDYGNQALRCNGADEAIEIIKKYLNIGDE